MVGITKDTARWIKVCLRTRRPDQDRRSARRFAARSSGACLRWDHEGRAVTVAGVLKDVSLTGFAAEIETFNVDVPAVGERVWVCLGSQPAQPWVAGVVVAQDTPGTTTKPRDEPRKALLRVRFGKGCPYPFFLVASDGLRRRSASHRTISAKILPLPGVFR
jgi:hypothetical protein